MDRDTSRSYLDAISISPYLLLYRDDTLCDIPETPLVSVTPQ
jgi:hypothetical protein